MSLIRSPLSFVLLVTLTCAVPLSKSVDVPKNSTIIGATDVKYRLPETVKPSYYTIELEPDIVSGVFKGTSEINITVSEPTDKIVLHAKDLIIDQRNTSLTNDVREQIKISTHVYDNKTDFLTLHLLSSIANGNYTLRFQFGGSLLHNDLHGFYRTWYQNSQGQQVWLAITQFDPTWARRAFPCFDEPAMKAQFKISIIHFENYTAVSNMPARLRDRLDNGYLSKWQTYFDVTPIMSTYLVAFVISDFEYLANDDGLGKYAFSVGQSVLEHLENYTDIYVKAKIDNFTIPQLLSVAMQNWDIVTYESVSSTSVELRLLKEGAFGLAVESETITLNVSKQENWIIFNKQQTGYYRVNYDTENWKLIAKYLKSEKNTKIHVLNRAQLLDDSFNLAQANVLPDHTTFLEISEYLKHEDDYIPWYAAFRAFSFLNDALANTKKYDLFKLYVLRLMEKLEKTVGYIENEKDDHIMKLNKLKNIEMACAMGSAKCLAASHDKLVEHIVGSKKSSPDYEKVVLCAGMRTANATIWERTYNLAATSNIDITDRKILLEALGCSSNATILKSYLQLLLVNTSVSIFDFSEAVYTGTNILFDFIIEHFDEFFVNDTHTEWGLYYLDVIGRKMANGSQVDKLEDFIKSLPKDKKHLTIPLQDGALASAKNNVEWLKKYEPQISSFLDAQKLVDAQPDKSN